MSASKNKLTVGIVGTGVMAREHAKSLTRCRRVKKLYCCDKDPERVAAFCNAFGAQVLESPDELSAAADIVWISTPQFAHREAVTAACNAGKAVFCEKPLANSERDLKGIEKAVRKAGVPFFMGQSGRYNAVFRKIKTLVDEGAVGEPTRIWSLRHGYVPLSKRPAWSFNDELSGGAMVELGVHEIDYARWVGGEFASVCAHASNKTLVPGACQDAVLGTGEMASGALVSIDISWSDARYAWQRGVVGTEGSLLFDDSTFPQVVLYRPNGKTHVYKTANWVYEPTGENESIRNQAQAVLDALETGAEPPVTLEDGAKAVRVALAMRRSAETGRVVCRFSLTD